VTFRKEKDVHPLSPPTNLRCEYAVNPMGIDVISPRFSWILGHSERGQVQSAYQVLVATNEENLSLDKGDMWDSGKVLSDQSINVVYKGKQLESGKTYYWKVCVWDKDNRRSPWSKVNTFEMGLLKPEDWEGEWIGSENLDISSPLLRKEFTLDKQVKRARAYICGLGYYELRINGKKVGDHVLDPAWTNYDKRVLYVTYDVTDYLKKGKNAIGVMLGNGRYSKVVQYNHLKFYGFLKMILQMNVVFVDGSSAHIVSDGTWKMTSGPIIANNIYHGETYDARLEKTGWDKADYDDSDWDSVTVMDPPEGKLKAQMLPPIKVTKTITPVKVTNPRPGVYVYDMGQNFAGWARLKVKGPRGTKVVLRFAEEIYEDGMIDPRTNKKAKATDTYILKGEGVEIYEPRFTYHGFRYVEVTGFPGTPTLENLEGRVVHSAVEPVGSFTCSNSLINQIHHNIVWGQLSNLYSVPTDCPQRNERNGFGGDGQVTAGEAIHNFDMALFYTKWLDDMADSQITGNGTDKEWMFSTWPPEAEDGPDGNIENISPSPFHEVGATAWTTAYIQIPWYLYQYYGDRRILEKHYNGMKRLVSSIQRRAVNHIVRDRLGDWLAPGCEGNPPEGNSLVATGYYYYDVWILSQVAKILGKSEDAEYYSNLADKIKDAFNEKFFDEDAKQYHTEIEAGYRQTSNAFPLFLHIVPKDSEKAVLDNLVKNIMVDHEGHLDTGLIGTKLLMEALTCYGRGDTMYKILTQTTYPSWGYMISKGATTLWETWEYIPRISHNHIMFGSVDEWLYRGLAGINCVAPGYKEIAIKPYIPKDLERVDASIKTIRGLISSSWRKHGSSLTLDVTIPVNAQAKVSIPKMGLKDVIVKENGKTIWRDGSYVQGVAGIKGASDNGDYITFEVGSGTYSFEVSEDYATSKQAHS